MPLRRFNPDRARRMLMGFDVNAPTAGLDMSGIQDQQDPLLEQRFKPQQGALPPPSREPGMLKRLLMNFTYNLGEGLARQFGMETTAEREQRALENQMVQERERRLEENQQGQLDIDRRNLAIAEAREKRLREVPQPETDEQAIARRKREAKAEGFNDTQTMEYVYGLKPAQTDTSLSETEMMKAAAEGQPWAVKALKDRRDFELQKARAGRSVTNTGGGGNVANMWADRIANPNDPTTLKDVPGKEKSAVIAALAGRDIMSGKGKESKRVRAESADHVITLLDNYETQVDDLNSKGLWDRVTSPIETGTQAALIKGSLGALPSQLRNVLGGEVGVMTERDRDAYNALVSPPGGMITVIASPPLTKKFIAQARMLLEKYGHGEGNGKSNGNGKSDWRTRQKKLN